MLDCDGASISVCVFVREYVNVSTPSHDYAQGFCEYLPRIYTHTGFCWDAWKNKEFRDILSGLEMALMEGYDDFKSLDELEEFIGH
jgi:hypothetical protein